MERWRVGSGQSGITLLAFLRGQLGTAYSAKELKRAIDSGRCTLNGKSERFASRLVGTGDQVTFDPPAASASPLADLASRILYSDDHFIALDKPPGIASDSPALIRAIRDQFPGAILLHRLDKDTTGVLLFGRTAAAAEAIEALFKERAMEKTYLALVDGIIKNPHGTIDNALGKVRVYQGQTLWGEVPKGLHAHTDWEVVKRGKDATLVHCRPMTGRTHQIRVHMSGLGHPILGDTQYGKVFRCAHRPHRYLLHASALAFKHPMTGRRVEIGAPLPGDFKEAIDILMGEK